LNTTGGGCGFALCVGAKDLTSAGSGKRWIAPLTLKNEDSGKSTSFLDASGNSWGDMTTFGAIANLEQRRVKDNGVDLRQI
jgi:hypothetical protein